MSRPLVSIISINYNSLSDTIEFLESVDRLTYPELEIILVDNASRENPKEIINRQFPDVHVIVSDENLGFAGGNNLGILASRGEYLLFLNNDTLLFPDFVETLVDFMQAHPDAGMASPKVLFPDGRTIQYAGTTRISELTGRGDRLGLSEIDRGQYDRTYKTGLGHGAALIVPRKVVDEVGLMPELYFLYYEEHDWCEQIKRKGYAMYYVGTAKILHKESMSIGGTESPLKVYYLTRNRLLFMRRNTSGINLTMGIFFFLFISTPKNLLQYLVKGKLKLFKSYLSGIGWNLGMDDPIRTSGKKTMPKISVLIPDGESTLTKHVVHCLAMNKGVDIHILSKDPWATIRYSRFIKSFHSYDKDLIGSVPLPNDLEARDKVLDELIQFHHYDAGRSKELIAEIGRVVKKTGAQVIFPVDEHIVKILSDHKEEISKIAMLAPLPDKVMFETAINKWSLAEFLKGKGVPHPTTVKYSSGDAASTLEGLQYPVIIKPIDKGNAQGIETFDRPEALKSFFENQKLKHEYIIQPLIDGYDIDCSVLCMEGKIVTYTIQKAIVASKVRFRAAVGIEFLFDERVLKVVEKMMNILNWSGVAHIDLRFDARADEIKVIEVNARYWGSLMGSLNAGINFPVLAIKARMGEVVPKIKYKFSRYYQGDLPFRLLVKTFFRPEKQKVHLRETNLYYTIKDPLPVLLEKVRNIKTRF